ncbi:alpha/beta hydrolase [Shewanella nanhaiensis]|uniref:Alpha/beta fold hydrolase n=1 Tax=Shewanella nanhaiensis TaxID=2864872 RepID=A0ABS7E8D5_9GAMM|nr:alpha/beta fold hydrolase [Shewanella nanhaiensis]MBW8185885.1 alpha/beta fold hydrolase [Shewanella nanhaiensis]
MKTLVIGSTKHLFMALFYASLGVVIALLCASIWYLTSRPELDVWHKTELKSAYKRSLGFKDFSQLMALEQAIFDEVEERIYGRTPHDFDSVINRYVRGSLSDPKKWRTDWNRSYEWPQADGDFGVLLLHGMSDSPYATSHLAKHFKGNAHVLALRLPGHGTIPSGLIDIEWQDMASAVSLATEHMQKVLKGKPLYLVGFSTGAALGLNHELERLVKGLSTDYAGMVFLSPAIGLPPVAAGAKWQARLGELLGLEKLSWNSLQAEYDPFKYNSFAVNAGDVVYQLAERNQLLLNQLSSEGKLNIGPILTFQSLVDDTVSTASVVEELYQKLPESNHELVIFDINRTEVNMGLVLNDPLDEFNYLIDRVPLNFNYTLVENRTGEAELRRQVQATTNYAKGESSIEPIAQKWPVNVYSLSHVALPFPIEDSLYGPEGVHYIDRVQIGAASSRGERGVLGVQADEMLRQKWNPFFPYLLDKMDRFIDKQNLD